MRIERDASNSFTLAARPTVTPSRWLLRFNWVEDPSVEQLCIATAYAQTGQPVLLTFTEVDASPDPQAAEVTLPPGQWRLRVYEQDTTSLNYANSDRLVYDVLVEVVGAEAEPPAPTDPCAGSGGDCDDPFTVTINGPSNVFAEVDDPCGGDFNVPVNNTDGDLVGSEVDGAWQIGNALVLRDGQPYGSVKAEGSIDVPSDSDCPPTTVNGVESDTPTITVLQGGVEVGTLNPGTGVHTVPECDPLTVTINGIEIASKEDPCGEEIALGLIDIEDNNVDFVLTGNKIIIPALPCAPCEPIPLKFGWGAGDADTLVWTVTDDEAGAYTTYTNDGGSGSITYSKNGAGFASLTGTITLAVSDTIVVRRATPTSNGWVKWAP